MNFAPNGTHVNRLSPLKHPKLAQAGGVGFSATNTPASTATFFSSRYPYVPPRLTAVSLSVNVLKTSQLWPPLKVISFRGKDWACAGTTLEQSKKKNRMRLRAANQRPASRQSEP